ncbi:hypothetical protein Aduo_016185 [Ancylostoma duodenale]
MPSQRPSTKTISNKTKSSAVVDYAAPESTGSEPVAQPDSQVLLSKLLAILEEKAPEAVPLLNQLITALRPNPKDIVESEKRSRSIVISGMPEAGIELTASQRQAHTELSVIKMLDALDIEAKPVEIYRMGTLTDGRARLIKCVFPSQTHFFGAMKKARLLRQLPDFERVYIRRSTTQSERELDRELRRQARELNDKEHAGEKVYAVYRKKVVKVRDIPSIKASHPKNL